MTILGATPSPCPTVAPAVPFPVNVTMLNPEVVFALTVLVIDPAVLVEPEPLAFHCQATTAAPLGYPDVPIEKPLLLNDVYSCVPVCSAAVESLTKYWLTPESTLVK